MEVKMVVFFIFLITISFLILHIMPFISLFILYIDIVK